MSFSPAFSLRKNHQGELFSSVASRQLWQVSFTHQGVSRSPRRKKFSSWVAEEPVLEGDNGNGGKKLPIDVSLKLKSGILCASHLTELELDLRPG